MPVGFEYAGTAFTVGLLQLANVPMEEISSSVQTPMMEEPTKEADFGGEFGVPVTGSITASGSDGSAQCVARYTILELKG